MSVGRQSQQKLSFWFIDWTSLMFLLGKSLTQVNSFQMDSSPTLQTILTLLFKQIKNLKGK